MTRQRAYPGRSEPRRPGPGFLLSLWHLFFSVDYKPVTWQQRRQWRARALFFFVLGVVLTLAVQALLAKHFGICPK